jgi:hypothetical protein
LSRKLRRILLAVTGTKRTEKNRTPGAQQLENFDDRAKQPEPDDFGRECHLQETKVSSIRREEKRGSVRFWYTVGSEDIVSVYGVIVA